MTDAFGLCVRALLPPRAAGSASARQYQISCVLASAKPAQHRLRAITTARSAANGGSDQQRAIAHRAAASKCGVA